MYNSFLQLIQEAQEIDEMALRPEDYPDTYLAAAKRRGAEARDLQQIIKRLHDALKAMRWQEITWITRGGSYYPILPSNIQAILAEIRILSRNRDSFIEGILSKNVGTWATPTETSNSIHMEVDGGQRSHFPGGIPTGMRNIGLGYKLYRALLQNKTWLRSNTAGTLEKDNAWASLISPKVDAEGNLTEDDVHAILGESNVLAMIKTLPDATKISIAKRFIDDNISSRSITTRNFAMDDELKAIMPADYMAQLDPAERERIERERREREEQERRARLEAYAQARGIQWDDQPQIGDLVYIRQYALNGDTGIPLRIIAGARGNTVFAIRLMDYIRWKNDGELPENLNNYDNRTATNAPSEMKSYFAKVDPQQISGVDDGFASGAPFLSEFGTADERRMVKDLILGMVDPETAERIRAEREEREREETARREREETERRERRANDAARFGEPFEDFEDTAYKNALRDRSGFSAIPTYAQNRIRTQVSKIALSPAQMERFNRRKSTEVFAQMPREQNGSYYNTITGHEIEAPISGLGLVEFELEQLTSKRAVVPNEMVYINRHSTYFGIVAPVDYVTLNRARNEEYVYFRIFDNTSRTARKVAISVRDLKKIVAV